jgi:putative peptide zinc metalloprotease protein
VGAAGPKPRLVEGVELIGEQGGSGFKEPPSLARRADGQVLQLTALLYAVAELADGEHDVQAIADEVSRTIGRRVSADNIRTLLDKKLYPLGVVAGSDGSSSVPDKPDPLLGLKFRAAVIPESVSRKLGSLFKPLFFPPVILAAIAVLIATDYWLFFVHGIAQPIRQALYAPGIFLIMLGAVVLSAAFHEVGHATGCRYGGAEPGRMGCGLYLAWPAFYTDVTDAYRLGKRGRLRTDLGGVYFNVIFIAVTMGLFLITHYQPLLLFVLIEHVEIIHQLLPIVRLDGYYIVADMTGVPDLFARIQPILTTLLPGRKPDQRVLALKRWVRVAVTVWVLIVVPLLALELVVILIHLPAIFGTGYDSFVKQVHTIAAAFGRGAALKAVTGIVQVVALSIPLIGILAMIVRTAKRGLQIGWERTSGRPVARGGLVMGSVLATGLLAFAWLPPSHYRPIRPNQRGTVAQGWSNLHLVDVTSHGLVLNPGGGRGDPSPQPAPTITPVGSSPAGSVGTVPGPGASTSLPGTLSGSPGTSGSPSPATSPAPSPATSPAPSPALSPQGSVSPLPSVAPSGSPTAAGAATPAARLLLLVS